MASKLKKATFALHEEVLAAVEELVAKGAAASKNAFVERALVKELDDLRRQARRVQWEEAVRDPLFLKDLEDVEAAFRQADAETARKIG